MTTRLAVALLCLLSAAARADDLRYLSDRLPVPLHSEHKDSSKILNKSLTSGSQVKVLRDDNASGYSLVDAGGGTQGWVPTRFLTRDMPATMRLATMEKKLVSVSDGALQKEIAQLRDDNRKLADQARTAQQQIEDFRQASGNVVKLMEQNRDLIEKNQMLQSRVDALEAVKQKIRDSNNMDQFVYGGLLVIATLIVSFAIETLRKRRAYNSWS